MQNSKPTERARLSMATDYAACAQSPLPYLERIAEAGFTHVHWCHHWSTDFLYSESEVAQIARWLEELGLGVTDVHGSSGQEKAWMSLEEYRQLAGVELTENRMRMAARLGADVVVMHIPSLAGEGQWDQTRRTLDYLAPASRQCGVRIAIENGDFDDIGRLLAAYPADYLGLCYDSGHGNMNGRGLQRLDEIKDRLIAIHLHDNNGQEDQHKLVFSGTTDWPRLARVIAASSYRKWMNLEVLIGNTGIKDEKEFLAAVFETGTKFAGMVSQCK